MIFVTLTALSSYYRSEETSFPEAIEILNVSLKVSLHIEWFVVYATHLRHFLGIIVIKIVTENACFVSLSFLIRIFKNILELQTI